MARDERLHALAPDAFVLRDVMLDLSEGWVTPRIRAAVYDGYYEAPEVQIIEETMRPGDRVLDIGCGIGFVATLASRIVGGHVRCYDANPAMTAAARGTLERNGADATLINAVLQQRPASETAAFYVREEFSTSSLAPDSDATEISVPVLDIGREITEHAATYLVVDIEGGETDLLLGEISGSVRKICVECHPQVTPPRSVTAMLTSLLSQDFSLSLEHSRPPVLYFER
jgi:FkbM family methyltransferase